MSEIHALRERAKELRCLYQINEAVSDRAQTPPATFLRIVEAIPHGWQRPHAAGARIEYLGRSYVGPGYSSAGRMISEPIRLWRTEVGRIEVTDAAGADEAGPEPFLREERELLRTIAARVGEYLEWKQTQLLGERLPAVGEHWRWRQRYAEALAAAIDPDRFGALRVFIGGSTESGHAGPDSDIDLFIEFAGTPQQRRDLELWLEGWRLCLAELALQQTGHAIGERLIDVHWLEPPADPRAVAGFRALRLGGEGAGHRP